MIVILVVYALLFIGVGYWYADDSYKNGVTVYGRKFPYPPRTAYQGNLRYAVLRGIGYGLISPAIVFVYLSAVGADGVATWIKRGNPS